MAETISVKDGHASVLTRPESERDPARILAGLRRRWWVILLVGVLAAAGAYVVARGKTKKYQATSALLFSNSHFDQTLFNTPSFGTTDPSREAATNQALVGLPTIADLVAQQLHLPYGLV